MGMHVNIGEAKNRLSELVAASLRGEEVVLAKAGKPVARIVGLEDAVAENAAAHRAKRKAQWDAYIGTKKGLVDSNLDWLAPAYTDEELREFGFL